MSGAPVDITIFMKSLAGGGAQRVMTTLAGAFVERGLGVDFVLAERSGPWLEAVPSGARVIELEAGSKLAALPMLLRSGDGAASLLSSHAVLHAPKVFAAIPALVDHLAGARPRALLSAVDFSNIAALCAGTLARRKPGVTTRIVTSFHTHVSTAVEHSAHRRMKCLPRMLRAWLPRADAIAACSHESAIDLARLAGIEAKQVAAIDNPIDLQRIEADAPREIDHPWWGTADTPVVVSVGRLAPEKDHALLVEAFARVRKRRPLRLAILGEGPERARLEARIRALDLARHVLMPGFVADPFAWVARSAVFVLPSRYEGFGCALAEALACGNEVVACDGPGGVRAVLDNGRLGQLVPPGNVDAMATAIHRALDAPTPPEPRRARARDFSVDRAADRYLELLLGDQAPTRPSRSGA